MLKTAWSLRGTGAWQEAEKRAKYSKYRWISWVGKDGVTCAALESQENLKTALLAVGTKGIICAYQARTGSCAIYHWPEALRVWRDYKRGYRTTGGFINWARLNQ